MFDDQALLLRYTHSRDAEAFAQLVNRYSTFVFSVASRVTGNISAAEDVTQECFFALARQSSTIKGSLPTWLHRVATNLSVTVIRKETTRQRHEIQSSVTDESKCEPTWKQIAPLLDTALTQLPDDLREPLVQHFFLGRTQAQISKNLNIGQATVSRRIQEGVEILREHLKNAGVACGAIALSSSLVKNTSAAVPAQLSDSLVKMAIAGPIKNMATASAAATLIINAKLVVALTTFVIVGAIATYYFVLSPTKFSPHLYLSKLSLQGDANTQDSFSLAFQAAAKVLGRDIDYDSIYELSSNTFCPAIKDSGRECRRFWHVRPELGSKAIVAIGNRYGLGVQDMNFSKFNGNLTACRRGIAQSVIEYIESEFVVLINGEWQLRDNASELVPWAGIVTDAHSNGVIFGATNNGRQNNLLYRPHEVWILSPGSVKYTPHRTDLIVLQKAVNRIRSKDIFQNTQDAVYGLNAMDSWIKAMSETPAFCPICEDSWQCAAANATTTYQASLVAARYLRRIASDFPPAVQSYLNSAAARYDRIAKHIAPFSGDSGRDSYVEILKDLATQKAHAANVLSPIRSEYVAIANDIELVLRYTQSNKP